MIKLGCEQCARTCRWREGKERKKEIQAQDTNMMMKGDDTEGVLIKKNGGNENYEMLRGSLFF
jgi:hypothetical protein